MLRLLNTPNLVPASPYKMRHDESILFNGRACTVKNGVRVDEGFVLVTDRRLLFNTLAKPPLHLLREELEQVQAAYCGLLNCVVIQAASGFELSLIVPAVERLEKVLQAQIG